MRTAVLQDQRSRPRFADQTPRSTLKIRDHVEHFVWRTRDHRQWQILVHRSDAVKLIDRDGIQCARDQHITCLRGDGDHMPFRYRLYGQMDHVSRIIRPSPIQNFCHSRSLARISPAFTPSLHPGIHPGTHAGSPSTRNSQYEKRSLRGVRLAPILHCTRSNEPDAPVFLGMIRSHKQPIVKTPEAIGTQRDSSKD